MHATENRLRLSITKPCHHVPVIGHDAVSEDVRRHTTECVAADTVRRLALRTDIARNGNRARVHDFRRCCLPTVRIGITSRASRDRRRGRGRWLPACRLFRSSLRRRRPSQCPAAPACEGVRPRVSGCAGSPGVSGCAGSPRHKICTASLDKYSLVDGRLKARKPDVPAQRHRPPADRRARACDQRDSRVTPISPEPRGITYGFPGTEPR